MSMVPEIRLTDFCVPSLGSFAGYPNKGLYYLRSAFLGIFLPARRSSPFAPPENCLLAKRMTSHRSVKTQTRKGYKGHHVRYGFRVPVRWTVGPIAHRQSRNRRVLNGGGDIPDVIERILHACVAVSIRLVSRRADGGGARLERALVPSIGILHVEVEHGRHRLIWAVGLPHLNHRVANPDLGVVNCAIRSRVAC